MPPIVNKGGGGGGAQGESHARRDRLRTRLPSDTSMPCFRVRYVASVVNGTPLTLRGTPSFRHERALFGGEHPPLTVPP